MKERSPKNDTGNKPFFRFIHQQRTGGQSIKLALLYEQGQTRPSRRKQATHTWNLWGNVRTEHREEFKRLCLGVTHNLPARMVKDQYPSSWAAAYTFSIVRNPYPRVYSMYYHRLQHRASLISAPKGGAKKGRVSFPEWVEAVYLQPASERTGRGDSDGPRNLPQGGILAGPPGWSLPQWDWVSSEAGDLIVDFVGRFETIGADFKTIQAHVGNDAKLQRGNGHPNRPRYQEAYTEKTIEIVREAYAIDFEKFNYDINFS